MTDSDIITISEADEKKLARMGKVVGALTKVFSVAAAGATLASAAHFSYEAAQGALDPALAGMQIWINSLGASAIWSMATTFLAVYDQETINGIRKNVIDRYAEQGMEKLAQEQDVFLKNLGSREEDKRFLDETDMNILATIPDEKFLDAATTWPHSTASVFNTLTVYNHVSICKCGMLDPKTYFKDLANNQMKAPERTAARINDNTEKILLFMAGLRHFSDLRNAFNGHWAPPAAADFTLPAPGKPDLADVAAKLQKKL